MKSIANLLVSWGPLGVLLLAVLDSAGIPLPAGVEALILVVATLDPPRAYMSAGLATLGSLGGNLFLYYLARKGGERFLDQHTSSGRSAKFRGWFQRYGLITVFVPAILPVPLPLKAFVLCAGGMGVKPGTFLLVVLAARLPRYFGLAWLGCKLGKGSGIWLKAHTHEMMLFAALLFAVLFLAVRLATRRPASQAPEGQ